MEVIVVVDPISSGKFLVEELRAQQWALVGVKSSKTIPDLLWSAYDPSRFVKTIECNSVEGLLSELSEFKVAAVLAGSEPGVVLAEELQSHLNLPGNGSKTSSWRRHKYDMQERIRECGLRAVGQLVSSDVEELIAWQRQWKRWPVIIKPTESCGTDGVHWCHNEDDIREAHRVEMGTTNLAGVINNQLLIQEFLDGLEYVVDCCSFEGRHICVAIWVYTKHKDPETRSITYKHNTLLESTGKIQDLLREYTFQCLDALAISHGPSHTEIIMVDGEPCLVETGARMHGMKGPKMMEECTGIGLYELVVDVAVNKARVFNSLHAANYRYILKKYHYVTFLHNQRVSGKLVKTYDVPELWQPSVIDVAISLHPGETLNITRDLMTSPGSILHVHACKKQILKDIEYIRNLEASDLYQVI